MTRSPAAVEPSEVDGDEEERQRQIAKNQPLIALLESWLDATEEEAEEQWETWEWLKRALDEDRPSDRKLFP